MKLSELTIDALIKWIERRLFRGKYDSPTKDDLHVWLKHAKKFKREQDNLKQKNEAQNNALAGAQVFAIELKAENDELRDAVAPIMTGAHGKECPHGINPVYPTHPWWCDECFHKLDTLLKAKGE